MLAELGCTRQQTAGTRENVGALAQLGTAKGPRVCRARAAANDRRETAEPGGRNTEGKPGTGAYLLRQEKKVMLGEAQQPNRKPGNSTCKSEAEKKHTQPNALERMERVKSFSFPYWE